ncbi:metal ABC transporter permease [Campylobacter peloridis]|uniref:metal ABC transporter permease n=1 Tax=Campylobacter peloridis TaxID=488546 RepID=UPI001C739FC5|nr:metal ABC transporter permease [Campylobacter peloridis]MBX2078537.1 metal ABC transporter permease [Campylobacter peloridis]
MLELLSSSFIQNAFLAAFLTSIACGIMGTLIMINRLTSMAGGITHGAFGGIGIAFYFGLPVLISTSLFTLFLALLVAFLVQKYPFRSDNIVGVIWAFGMAVGIIFIDLSPGYNNDLMGYLFGSILSVPTQDIILFTFIDVVFIVLILLFYRQFEILSFDKEFASLRGVKTNIFHYLLIAMLAFCIVISIKVVGLVLVIALLSIPAFIAEKFSKKLGQMMVISTLLSISFCLIGLFVSFYYNLASGACIIASACIGFMLYLCFSIIFKKLA